jgi:putative membrane protein
MNRYARWGFAIALMPLAACASNTPPAAPAAPPGPPPLAASDAAFIQMAAQGGMTEIQLGQLAEQTSKSRAVKAFARHMIKDHTANNDQLKQIATTKGATVPTSLNDQQQATMTKLQGEKGRKFDHDYIASQVQGHEQMLSAFQTEASSGGDPDLKSFAAQTVPVIQEHLKDAEKLAGPMHHGMMHHHRKSSAS